MPSSVTASEMMKLGLYATFTPSRACSTFCWAWCDEAWPGSLVNWMSSRTCSNDAPRPSGCCQCSHLPSLKRARPYSVANHISPYLPSSSAYTHGLGRPPLVLSTVKLSHLAGSSRSPPRSRLTPDQVAFQRSPLRACCASYSNWSARPSGMLKLRHLSVSGSFLVWLLLLVLSFFCLLWWLLWFFLLV